MKTQWLVLCWLLLLGVANAQWQPTSGGGTGSVPINGAPPQNANYNAQGFKLQNLGQAAATADALGWGQAALVTNLTASGAISIAGTGTAGGDNLSNVNVNGDINPKTYGAKCDVLSNPPGTDDTTAIQNASNFAFTHGRRLVLPPGSCRITQLNWTNYQVGQVQVAGRGRELSKLVCRESAFNTGVCVDMTDTQYAALNSFAIVSEGAGAPGTCASTSTCAPKITLLVSDTVFSPGVNSQVYDVDHVKIDNIGTDAASAGSYALYDYGGEIFQASHFYFRGGTVAAALFTIENAAGIASPFRGALATPPTSMTTVSLTQGLIDARGSGAWGVMLEVGGNHSLANFAMDGVYVNTGGPGFIEGVGAGGGSGTISALTLDNIRYEPQGGATSTFGVFDPQVQNIHMSGDTFAGVTPPTVPILQFNKTVVVSLVGGYIDLRPSDFQTNYPTGTVISCYDGASGVIFDSVDAAGGGPLNTSGCQGLAINYHGWVGDTFLYNGTGSNKINACNATFAGIEKWVSDGVTGCTPYGGTYTAGAGGAVCKVGCPAGGSSWLYGF